MAFNPETDPYFVIQGIPRDPDCMVRALPCPTGDFEKAMRAAKSSVADDPDLIGFVLYDKGGVEIARWMASEKPSA
jgi:hypothetical protein